MGFPGDSGSKEFAHHAGDSGSISGLGWCPGEGNGNPLQYSCLENPLDRGAWQATVHGVRVRHDWAANTFTGACTWIIHNKLLRKAPLGGPRVPGSDVNAVPAPASPWARFPLPSLFLILLGPFPVIFVLDFSSHFSLPSVCPALSISAFVTPWNRFLFSRKW